MREPSTVFTAKITQADGGGNRIATTWFVLTHPGHVPLAAGSLVEIRTATAAKHQGCWFLTVKDVIFNPEANRLNVGLHEYQAANCNSIKTALEEWGWIQV